MLKQIKSIIIIVVSVIILSIILTEVSAATCEKLPIHVQTLGKIIPVYVRGNGLLPMLVVGPATLFHNSYLPESFDKYFKIYFVDIFTKVSSYRLLDINEITLDDFVGSVESIRKQLKLDKVVLFGHSANGILALKYSEKFPEHVLCNILVGTTPFRGSEKSKISDAFFASKASIERKNLYESDKKKLAGLPPTYVNQYNAKRTWNFFDLTKKETENIWRGINLDENLIKKYFSLIDDFDIRQNMAILKVPTFLGLGSDDYTCPPVLWTEGSKRILNNPLLRHFVFDKSAHYPMIENEGTFMQGLSLFLKNYNIVAR